MGDVGLRAPGPAAVGRAAQENVNGSPVTAVAPARLAVGQDRAALGGDDAGDPVERVAILSGGEKIRLFDERRGSRCVPDHAEDHQSHQRSKRA